MTSNKQLLDLLEQVARGEMDAAAAHARLLDELRARPYEDLGFARVDHHRSIRQGFPEVVLGLGKTPGQIAAIADEIVRRGSTLLVTRASLTAARVIIVVAGMEGALPSVIAGLVSAPVIAVPTSVGYGASFGGIAALLGMLNSCASGVSVVNIDNGFGAANIASLINHL